MMHIPKILLLPFNYKCHTWVIFIRVPIKTEYVELTKGFWLFLAPGRGAKKSTYVYIVRSMHFLPKHFRNLHHSVFTLSDDTFSANSLFGLCIFGRNIFGIYIFRFLHFRLMHFRKMHFRDMQIDAWQPVSDAPISWIITTRGPQESSLTAWDFTLNYRVSFRVLKTMGGYSTAENSKTEYSFSESFITRIFKR